MKKLPVFLLSDCLKSLTISVPTYTTGVKTKIGEAEVEDLKSLAEQFPALKEIDSYPYLDYLQSKTAEELISIKDIKDRQAHLNAQEAMRTGDSLRSKTADILFKECRIIQRYLNLLNTKS